MRTKIEKGEFPLLQVTLLPGEEIYAEPGALMTAEADITPITEAGGFMKGLKRLVSGERIFVTRWKNEGSQERQVLLTVPFPGSIVPVDVGESEVLVQRSAFVAAQPDVQTEARFTKKFGAGLFGGQGFVLQSLSGKGTAWFHAGGKILERRLKKGEQLRVVTDHVVGFQETVDFDVKIVPKIGNVLFGGIGLFWATLTGPGKVYLQTMPIRQLALSVYPYMPQPNQSAVSLLNPQDAKLKSKLMR